MDKVDNGLICIIVGFLAFGTGFLTAATGISDDYVDVKILKACQAGNITIEKCLSSQEKH